MRLRVIQEAQNGEWGMECQIDTLPNLPKRLLAIGKGTFEVSEKDGEVIITLHN